MSNKSYTDVFGGTFVMMVISTLDTMQHGIPWMNMDMVYGIFTSLFLYNSENEQILSISFVSEVGEKRHSRKYSFDDDKKNTR